MKYPIFVQSQSENGYVASVIGLPDCVAEGKTEEEAVRIANDTPYGLSGYVFGGTVEHARRIAARLRTGMVHVNGAPMDFAAPFGGYRQSGNGREWGAKGLEEFLETKAVMGFSAA